MTDGDRVLVDTDILSEILKGRNPQVYDHYRQELERWGMVSFTSIYVMEILQGIHKRNLSRMLHTAETFFAAQREIEPSSSDYRLAGEINGKLLAHGWVIGIADPLIAACAIRLGYGVATGNTAHFGYIQEAGYPLQIVNWRN